MERGEKFRSRRIKIGPKLGTGCGLEATNVQVEALGPPLKPGSEFVKLAIGGFSCSACRRQCPMTSIVNYEVTLRIPLSTTGEAIATSIPNALGESLRAACPRAQG